MQTLCSQGRITDATKFGREWAIPINAQKPDDARVTSGNNNLDIQYYTDAAHSNPIDTASCYMNPGNSIYA